mgnify:CR=1 FL=1
MKKRILIAVLFALFVATLFTSCKSQDCPTYDQSYVEINLFE